MKIRARVRPMEDMTIEALRTFITKWRSIFVITGGGLGLLYQHKRGVDDLSLAIQRIREDLRSLNDKYISDHAVGNDGFSDPNVRLALDQHIRTVLRANNAELLTNEIVSWRKMLFDLNPQLKKPTD